MIIETFILFLEFDWNFDEILKLKFIVILIVRNMLC